MNFVEKHLIFAIKTLENVNEYLKLRKNYDRQLKPDPKLVGYLTAVPRDICTMQATIDCADDSARPGWTQEKEKIQLLN